MITPAHRLRKVLEPLSRVSRRQALGDLAARLEALGPPLVDSLARVRARLQAFPWNPEGTATLHQEAARHLLHHSGKCLRPLCLLLGAKLGGQPAEDDTLVELALACELVHAATLLHDDVIDEGEQRRGLTAARMVYGNAASVLAGDHLLVVALQLVAGVGRPVLLTGLLDTIARMVAAEALQLEQRGNLQPGRQRYLEVIAGKTASLFAWALWAGGLAGGLTQNLAAGLTRVGRELGAAFQLQDDLLDIGGNPALTGKDPFADLRQGKLTWPLILAGERDPGLFPTLQRAVDDGDAEWFRRELVPRLHALGAVADTEQRIREHTGRACAALGRFPAGPARAALELVIEAVARRTR